MTPDEKELLLLEKTALEFARKELAPHRRENDAHPFGPFFSPVLDKAFQLDFFHALPPEEAGGLDQGICAFSVLLESLCREDASLGAILFSNACAQEIMLAAKQAGELKQIAEKFCGVTDCLIAFPAFNNPSEIDHIAQATYKNDGYLISGAVDFLTMGGMARHGLIPARLTHGKTDDFSWFLVDLTDSRVTKSEMILSLGLRGCPAADVVFDHAPARLMGDVGNGAACFKMMSEKMNLAAAAMSCGVMKGSFDEALGYSKNRMQGGKKIIDWTEFQMLLANMALQIEMASLALKSARQKACEKTRGWQNSGLAVAAVIQKEACDVTSAGIQALGGVGYMKDFGQEKRFRDAQQLQALLGLAPLKRINYLRRKMGQRDLSYGKD